MIYFPNNFGGRQFPLGAPNERDSRDDWVIFMNKSNILPLLLTQISTSMVVIGRSCVSE